MKEVCCNFCGQDNWQLVSEGRDLLLDRPGHFRLVRCQQCGLIYQNPQATREELGKFYPDDYLLYETNGAQATQVEALSQQHELGRRCARVMRHWPNPGTVLDVGCATGNFLVAMRERGWQTVGVGVK